VSHGIAFGGRAKQVSGMTNASVFHNGPLAFDITGPPVDATVFHDAPSGRVAVAMNPVVADNPLGTYFMTAKSIAHDGNAWVLGNARYVTPS
jgi:hypothetical protein